MVGHERYMSMVGKLELGAKRSTVGIGLSSYSFWVPCLSIWTRRQRTRTVVMTNRKGVSCQGQSHKEGLTPYFSPLHIPPHTEAVSAGKREGRCGKEQITLSVSLVLAFPVQASSLASPLGTRADLGKVLNQSDKRLKIF